MSASGIENLNRLQFKNQDPCEVQRLLEQIYGLKTNLNLTDQCILNAIEFAREILMKYFDGKFNASVICQTALFLACKCQDTFRSSEDIYKRTMKVFDSSPNETQPNIDTFKNNLFDCENYMICKLGFEKIFRKLSKCIKETVDKIPDDTLTRGRKYELARIACVLVEGSIAMKPICLGLTSELIACFCVQLAIEVQKYQFPPDIWVKDAVTFGTIQSVMDKYSRIFSQCSSVFEKTFGNERSLYIKVNEITSKRVDKLNDLSLHRPIYLEECFLQAGLGNNRIESNAATYLPATTTRPTLYGLSQQMSHTNRVGQFNETGDHLTGDEIEAHIQMNRPDERNGGK